MSVASIVFKAFLEKIDALSQKPFNQPLRRVDYRIKDAEEGWTIEFFTLSLLYEPIQRYRSEQY